MKSPDLCIVHLSDLHFRDAGSRVMFTNLISDIVSRISDEKYVAFVITGDLALQDNLGECGAFVVSFFKDLVDSIPQNTGVVDVEVVPGNHDGHRALKVSDYNNKTYLHDNSDYSKIAEKIYHLFNSKFPGIELKNSAVHGSTFFSYGVHRVAFYRIDTSSYGSVDRLYRDIGTEMSHEEINLVSKFEDSFTSYIKSQCADIDKALADEVKNGRIPDLNIMLSHHPLSALVRKGESDQENALFLNNLGFIDLWLSGHTHIAQRYFTSDNNRQRIQLSTGLGWQESGHDVMRYSVYRLNLERNTCHVEVRSTTPNKGFGSNRVAGSNNEFTQSEKETLPLALDSVGAAIYANSVMTGYQRALYVKGDVIKDIPRVLYAIDKAREKILRQLFIDNKPTAANQIRLTWFGDKLYKVNDLLGRPFHFNFSSLRVATRSSLRDFLKTICKELSEVLAELVSVQSMEGKDGVDTLGGDVSWRVHVRLYKARHKDYICSRLDKFESIEALDIKGEEAVSPRVIPWGGMIKAAFDHKKWVLINSANPSVNEIETLASDFMTIIPSCEQFHKKFSRKEYRPLLSFGISLFSSDVSSLRRGTQVLYLLEYLRINALIDEALQMFIDQYGLTKKSVLTCL